VISELLDLFLQGLPESRDKLVVWNLSVAPLQRIWPGTGCRGNGFNPNVGPSGKKIRALVSWRAFVAWYESNTAALQSVRTLEFTE
jgi:hypothetical protein